jgi:tripartite-type tricarboxylate transporter receptor subunit TctC
MSPHRAVSSLRCALVGSLALLATSLLPGLAAAAYPDRPIRVIVPFPAGGGGDTLARTVLNKVAQQQGWTIVIENRAGAGGNIGTEAAARSTPDGYTLAYGTNGTHAINQTLYKKTGFDPIKDFAPISRLTEIALILVVNPTVPANSPQELLAYLKANPGKVNLASAGNGTTSHLAGELFRVATGADFVHVPYRGGAPAMTDLIGGQVQFMIEVMPNAFQHVQSGKLRGLAVSTARRWPQTPEIPTLIESGIPGFEVIAWDALLAPKGTPPEIISTINAAVRQALADPALKEALLARGAQATPSSPEELGKHIEVELARWGKAVEQSGAKLD